MRCHLRFTMEADYERFWYSVRYPVTACLPAMLPHVPRSPQQSTHGADGVVGAIRLREREERFEIPLAAAANQAAAFT